LAEGATSSVIETDHSLRILRVVSRVPAGYKPFEEVAESIRGQLKEEWQQKAVQQLAAQALIEFAYPPDGAIKADGAFFWEQKPLQRPSEVDGDDASANDD
jgi:hypothetical protein